MKNPCDELCCPLCTTARTALFFEEARRCYHRCAACGLVFVPRRYWLSAEAERATYDLHENDAQDQGYRRFLARLSAPLLARLGAGQKGLDFGCGPGPALSHILEAEGHQVDLHDPFYCDTPSVFQKQYDFICATEVVEHLRQPAETFETLFKMLKRGGWLAIMTKMVIDHNAFRQWHYIRDLTHICFYHRSTFAYIAVEYNAEVSFVENDVIFLRKSKAQNPNTK